MPFRTIPNDELTLAHIPQADEDWLIIMPFAMSFDGYGTWGSFHGCAEVANARRHETLTELRTCLFFEYRRWHHIGDEPNQEAVSYIHSLVEQIRSRVAAGLLTWVDASCPRIKLVCVITSARC